MIRTTHKEMSWKEDRLDYIDYFYKEKAYLWKDEHDDRKLFSNIYFHMREAVESLEDEPHGYVKVAINHALRKDYDMMDEIIEHFKGR